MSTQLVHCGAESLGSSLGCPLASAATQYAVLTQNLWNRKLSEHEDQCRFTVGPVELDFVLGAQWGKSKGISLCKWRSLCSEVVLVPGILGKDTPLQYVFVYKSRVYFLQKVIFFYHVRVMVVLCLKNHIGLGLQGWFICAGSFLPWLIAPESP